MYVKERRHPLYEAYASQRDTSTRRGIQFLLTLEEWVNIWESSGKLPQRGRKKGQYCMARFGDVGPYAVGNVKIMLSQKNTSDGNKGKKLVFTEEHKKNISLAKIGKPPRPGPVSEATRAKMRAHRLGKPLSAITRQRISLAAKRRYAQCS
jgi:hypothetical protein